MNSELYLFLAYFVAGIIGTFFYIAFSGDWKLWLRDDDPLEILLFLMFWLVGASGWPILILGLMLRPIAVGSMRIAPKTLYGLFSFASSMRNNRCFDNALCRIGIHFWVCGELPDHSGIYTPIGFYCRSCHKYHPREKRHARGD